MATPVPLFTALCYPLVYLFLLFRSAEGLAVQLSVGEHVEGLLERLIVLEVLDHGTLLVVVALDDFGGDELFDVVFLTLQVAV